MKRRHSIEADDPPAPDRDAEAALSAALAKLAVLRQQVHADWSAGIAELVDFANADDAATDDATWTIVAPASIADGLRGRFLDLDEPTTTPSVDVDASWLTLATEIEPPIARAEPLLELRGRLAPDTPEPLAFRADVHVRAPTPDEHAVAQAIAALPTPDDDDLILGVGAFVNYEMLESPAPTPEPETPKARFEEEPAAVSGYGAAAGILALAAPMPEAVPAPRTTAPALAFDDEPVALAPGAAAGLDALFALLAPASLPDAAQPPVDAVATEETRELAVGAFAIVFDIVTAEPPSDTPAATPEESDEAPDFTFGAHPALGALFDEVPAPLAHTVETRAFDPESLIDDALADAFEALLCAHDPLESAWAADAVAFDAYAPAALLAQCETALWDLPRHVPCIEAFLATPNHETAVKLTRALRLRTHALEARAFAEGVDFGFLQNVDADAGAFWFMADALSDATGFSAGDADVEVSFPDWEVSDAGLIVVNAPGIAPPRPAAPLISEAELDALFVHVDDARAHVLDDLGERNTWDEPYWADVDAYLATETTSWDPDDLEHLAAPYDPAHEILDIEVRDNTPAPPATHFWMPGDEPDLAIEGEGDDLFIVGGGDGDDAAVILLEDGATYAMRTGHAARMDEVIVSLSHDRWTHIDAMRWTRLAALSGVASVRVEQTATASRRLVAAGVFLGTALADGGARLVRSGEDGEEDHPVIRLGEATPFSFSDLGGVTA